MAIELMPVSENEKSVALRDLVLGILDQRAFEFLNLSAFGAHEMIVMFVFDFVACNPVIKVSFGRQACFDEQLHRPVNRRIPNIGMLFADASVEVFARHVALRLEERRENQLTLLRMLELVALKIRTKRLQFDFVGHDGSVSLLDGTFLRST